MLSSYINQSPLVTGDAVERCIKIILFLWQYSDSFMILAFSYRISMLKTHSTATDKNKDCSVNHISFIKINVFAIIKTKALQIKSFNATFYIAYNYWSKNINTTQTSLSYNLELAGSDIYTNMFNSPGMQQKSRYRPLHSSPN